MREAGYFVSLMSRLVVSYPNWAFAVVSSEAGIDPVAKQRFQNVVLQTRRTGASKGRPAIAQSSPANPDARRH